MSDSIAIVTEVRFTVRDRMVIADPCYVDKDDGDTPESVLASKGWADWGTVLDGCDGEWRGEIDMLDNVQTAGWGARVSVLRLRRQGSSLPRNASHRADGGFEYVGSNGVDSGQMLATCVENLPVDYDALLSAYSRDLNGPYREHCLAFGGGIVSSTGYGDGVYPVYVVRDNNDCPAVVEVRFVTEDEDEEYCGVCGVTHCGAPCKEEDDDTND